MPAYENFNTVEENCGTLYYGEPEDLLHSYLPSTGMPVLVSIFLWNIMDDLTLGRSQTGIIHLLNKTTIYWYSKLQYCIKTDTYGSEFTNAYIFTYHIIYLQNTLCRIRVLFHMDNESDDIFIFDDKFLVVNLTVMPARKLRWCPYILNYHRTMEAKALVIVKFVHMNSNDNPADILNESRAYLLFY